MAVVAALAAAVHRGDGDMILAQDLDRIDQRIKAVEAKTSGEVVCVLAKQSDSYHYIPALWAALLALFVPLVFIVIEMFDAPVGDYADADGGIVRVYFVQLCVFLAAFLLGQWRVVKFALVPKYIKLRRAKRVAREAFMAQEISLTDDRTGVLLFISLAERYVEVIADHGIYAKLDDKVWQQIVDALIVQIKADKMADGIVAAVDEIGVLLARHFPDDGETTNELPDHLVILD